MKSSVSRNDIAEMVSHLEEEAASRRRLWFHISIVLIIVAALISLSLHLTGITIFKSLPAQSVTDTALDQNGTKAHFPGIEEQKTSTTPVKETTSEKRQITINRITDAKAGTTPRATRVKSSPEPLSQERAAYSASDRIKILSEQIKGKIRSKQFSGLDEQFTELGRLVDQESLLFLKLKGYALLSKEDYAGGLIIYQKLVKQRPQDLDLNLNLALAEMKLGEKENTLARLKALTSLYPDSNPLFQYIHLLQQ